MAATAGYRAEAVLSGTLAVMHELLGFHLRIAVAVQRARHLRCRFYNERLEEVADTIRQVIGA